MPKYTIHKATLLSEEDNELAEYLMDHYSLAFSPLIRFLIKKTIKDLQG